MRTRVLGTSRGAQTFMIELFVVVSAYIACLVCVVIVEIYQNAESEETTKEESPEEKEWKTSSKDEKCRCSEDDGSYGST